MRLSRRREQAVALADRLADATWLGFAEYGLGQAYFIAGRYRDAELLLNRASARLGRRTGKRSAGNDGIEPSRALSYDEGYRLCVDGRVRRTPSKAPGRQAISPKSNDRPYDIIAAGYGRGLVQHDATAILRRRKAPLSEAAFLSRENEVRLFLPLVLCALGNLHLQRGQAGGSEGHPA